MRPHQIETWALSVVDRIRSRQPIEDFRVELKRDWIPPEKAARRIAGHANAARGAPILWLFGIDENGQIPGVQNHDLASWFQQLEAHFDGVIPGYTDLNIPIKGRTVVALLFQTDRAPFVVKNPFYGSPQSGSVSLEVPWRAGTATRSATRADLIQILSPLQASPDLEVLEATLTASSWGKHNPDEDTFEYWFDCNLSLTLYVVIPEYGTVIIPFHRCQATLEIPGRVKRMRLEDIQLRPASLISKTHSLTVHASHAEVLVEGAGKVIFSGMGRIPFSEVEGGQDSELSFSAAEAAVVTASCLPVHATRKAVIHLELPRRAEMDEAGPRFKFGWHYMAPTP